VLLPVLMRILIIAFLTFELEQGECVHDETVRVFRKIDLAAAVGAAIFVLLPRVNAFIAAELVAILALLRVLHNLKANRACKVTVHRQDRIVCLRVRLRQQRASLLLSLLGQLA